MKKLFIFGLGVAFLMAGVSSCKKTSVRKMSNDWVISSYTENTTYTNNANQTSKEDVVATETTLTITSTDPNGDKEVMNGTVNSHTLTIKKDGTWERVVDITIKEVETGYTVEMNQAMTSSGTWNFLGKVDEFKKNERVIFNTLSDKTVTKTKVIITGGSTTEDTETNTNTYANGESPMVMVVVESKKKELELSQEGNATWSTTNSSGTTTGKSTSMVNMKLTQK